ncbi:tetratricopeptide repeat protein [Streptomyces bottropensis]|uniref:tetratricopeptide repeat protein n=1 Tax=Streptomyces bottropensis TaxID=42235 RepID=UPI00369A4522
MTISSIAKKLTPDHFHGGMVPSRSSISARLSGEVVPPWDFIEAILDVCVDNPLLLDRRVSEARHLWIAANRASTPIVDTQGPRQLGHNSGEGVTEAYERLVQAQDSLIQAQRAKADADRLVAMLLAINASLQRRIGELERGLGSAKYGLTSVARKEFSEGDALLSLGSSLHQVGRVDEAIEAHQRAASLFRDSDDRRGVALALLKLGAILSEIGRLDEAIELQECSVQALHATE